MIDSERMSESKLQSAAGSRGKTRALILDDVDDQIRM